MQYILLDIKHHIASFDEKVWFLMYYYDPEFTKFACSEQGISLFKKNFNTMTVDTIFSVQQWRLCGRLHRDNDLPAQIYLEHGTKIYYRNGRIHRDCDEFGEDQPAVYYMTGALGYYDNGNRHRNGDKPAIVYNDGGIEYYKYGQLHWNCDANGNSQPAIIQRDGSSHYYQNGLLHRDDDRDGNPQPALISSIGTTLGR